MHVPVPDHLHQLAHLVQDYELVHFLKYFLENLGQVPKTVRDLVHDDPKLD